MSAVRFAAHRGVHRADEGVKENTLAAVRAAVAAHADLVEIDVRLTKDGQVVILHDPDLRRVWGDPRAVQDMTLSDLRVDGADADHRVPLLSEALEIIADSGSLLLIDMDNPAFAAPAFEVVRRMGLEHQVEWCGVPEGMQTIRNLSDDAVIWLAWEKSTLPTADDLTAMRPQVINLPYLVTGKALVKRAHELGLQVHCWTVDDPMFAAWMVHVGVDGITTNHFETIRQAALQAENTSVETKLDERRALYTVREIAAAAVDLILESDGAYRTNVHGKATPADLVTDLDKLIEQQVRDVLTTQFPEVPIVGEEMGGEEPESGYCWFLDPLDGSINFANAVPWFSFSLALVYNGEPVVGAVIDPAGWRVLSAWRGHGAWVDGKPWQIPTRTVNEQDPLGGTIVSVELLNNVAWPCLPHIFKELSDRYCVLRIPGTGTATVSGVALGRGVASLIGRFGPVDHYAGILLVHEAGGVVMDEFGHETLNPRSHGLLVARDHEVADIIAGVWERARQAQ